MQGARIESARRPEAMIISAGGDPPAEKLCIVFSSEGDRQPWYDEILARSSSPAEPPDQAPAGGAAAVLLEGTPDLACVDLGSVEFRHQPRELADQGDRLHAGLRRAEAVVGVVREMNPIDSAFIFLGIALFLRARQLLKAD